MKSIITFSVDTETLTAFKASVGYGKASAVLEALMKEYVAKKNETQNQ